MIVWWGHVESVSPLTVAREPGGTAIPAESTVAGLTVGDKVVVLMIGTSPTIIGENKTYA